MQNIGMRGSELAAIPHLGANLAHELPQSHMYKVSAEAKAAK